MLTVLPEHRARTLTLIRSKLDHDLRSNLNVILGYCSMCTEDLASGEDPSQLSDDLGYIAAAGRELLHLNNQVSDLLEIQQGKWRIAPTELEVDYVLQDVIDEVTEAFPAHTFVLDGEARLERSDARTIGRLLCWLLTQLCKSTSIAFTVEMIIEAGIDGAIIHVKCLIDELEEAEHRKLARMLAQLHEPVPVLNRIQDFDGYYRSVMCELADARIEADPQALSCRVTLSGPGEKYEETDSETLVG